MQSLTSSPPDTLDEVFCNGKLLWVHSTLNLWPSKYHKVQRTPKPDLPLWKPLWALGMVIFKYLLAAKSHWHLRTSLRGTNPTPSVQAQVSPFAISCNKSSKKWRAEALAFLSYKMWTEQTHAWILSLPGRLPSRVRATDSQEHAAAAAPLAISMPGVFWKSLCSPFAWNILSHIAI